MKAGRAVSSAEERIFGRDELLRQLVADTDQGRTLFALEGITGIGKSKLVEAFCARLQNSGFSAVILNLAELPSDELVVAAIYRQLRRTVQHRQELGDAVKRRFSAELPSTLRKLAGAVVADALSYATEHAENTIDTVKDIISGDRSGPNDLAKGLAELDENNQRYFIGEYLKAIVESGNRVAILLDNFESADVSAVELIRFLIKEKPDALALAFAHNSEFGDNTTWDRVQADVRAHRGRCLVIEPLHRAAISGWFESEVGRHATENELDALVATTHGRPINLTRAIAAIRSGVGAPLFADYAGYYEIARKELDRHAWTITELLAVLPHNTSVDIDLLAAAARCMGIDNVGYEIEQLRGPRLIKEDGSKISLAHSVVQDVWRKHMSNPRITELARAWFAAVRDLTASELAESPAAALVPVIAGPLIEARPADDVAELGARLIAGRQVTLGLDLLKHVWQFSSGRTIGAADMVEHALLAASTYLDLGRYSEVDEPLTQAERSAGGEAELQRRVQLLRMKLALRRNAYAALNALALQLRSDADVDVASRIEGELLLNTAYRDLRDLANLRDSTARLRELLASASMEQQNSIDRALARSFAKLGDYDEALWHAQTAITSSTNLPSIRAVGNAKLALAEVLRYRGEYGPSISAYQDAADIARASGNRDSQLWSLLGEAAAHIEAGNPALAAHPLEELEVLLHEPGYEHPLEGAHTTLLRALAGMSEIRREEILNLYAPLHITWPTEVLDDFRNSGRLEAPTPL